MPETEGAGSFIILFTRDGDDARLALADEPVIDAAVTQWVDSGRTRDRLLMLTTTGGAAYRVLASDITSWMESTPESRERERAINTALDAEVPAEPWREDG